MNVFEFQLLRVNNNCCGYLLFDRVLQKLRFHSDLSGQDAAGEQTMLLNYLAKEFRQMQQMMESGIPFSPFPSVHAISTQFLPDNPAEIVFSAARHIEAADIDEASALLRENYPRM